MKQRGKTIKIVFGEVFPYTNIDKSKNATEWAAYFRNLVYSLQKSKNNQKK
jgi:hypothetical protein